MIYQSLLQLKKNQRKVEVLLDNGQSSFQGTVLDLNPEYVLMSVLHDEEDSGFTTWHEVVIKLSFVSSIIYERELAPFLNKDQEEKYEEEFKKQE